jgi:type I restriction enzyme, S subunit
MSEAICTPKLRFPEYSGSWLDGKLGTYGSLINGLTYSPDNIVKEGLLVLRSSNIQNAQICLDDNVYVNVKVDDNSLTKEEDILICVRNGSKRLIGKSAIIKNDLPKSTHGAFMTVFRGESNKFISHWFQSSIYYKQVHRNLGATINSINGKDLKKFKTVFPTKPEQQKIATFFTSVDTKIEQLSKKQELLGEYKKGLMQKIFSQAIRFKADDGSDYPDWEEKNLGAVVDNIGGTALEKHTNPNSNYKFISIGNYGTNGKYIDNGQRVELNDKTKTKLLDKNNLVMVLNDKTAIGDIIGSTILIDKNDNYIYNQRSERLICKSELLPIFAWHYLNSRMFRRSVYSISQGGTQIYVNFPSVKGLKFNLPSKKEQTKIANFLSSIDSNIEQLVKQLDESKQFKKALLQQMFV